MSKTIFIIILSFILTDVLLAQVDKKRLLQTDTISLVKKVQVIGLPVVFYTPETSVGIGGGMQLFFQHHKNIFNARVSNIFISAIYTLNKQLMLSAVPQIHLFDGKMHLEGEVLYKVFPNSFWGIGSNTPETSLEKYNMRTTGVRISLLNRIPSALNFGFEYKLNIYTIACS